MFTTDSSLGCDDCSDGTTCDDGDVFECGDGQTIPSERECDGIRDCDNMADETMCPCSDDQFTCDDGGCVPLEYVCDKGLFTNDVITSLAFSLVVIINHQNFLYGWSL